MEQKITNEEYKLVHMVDDNRTSIKTCNESWTYYDKDGKTVLFINDYLSHQYYYDDNGNCIREVKSYANPKAQERYGSIVIHKYDENNNLISSYDTVHNITSTFKYDENNNQIYYKDRNGKIMITEYNDDNDITYRKTISDSDVSESWWTYNENGQVTFIKNSNGYSEERKYNNDGNMCYIETSNGTVMYYNYDEMGNIIHYYNCNKSSIIYGRSDMICYETWCTYDDNNNCIYKKNSNGDNEINVFNINNKKIYSRDGDYETYWIYDDNDELVLVKHCCKGKAIRETKYTYTKTNILKK